MVFINDSLTIVLIGDWNKLFIQPDWIAGNVYEKDEIEIGVNGPGADLVVSYRSEGVIVTPEQSKVIFSVANTDKQTLEYLCKCIENYVTKAYSAINVAYGFNCDFIEDNDIIFADVLDRMSDTTAIIGSGYEIVSSKVTRTIRKEDRLINMEASLENAMLNMHFNEHHNEEGQSLEFNYELLKDFMDECSNIVRDLGYELEGDE